MTAKQGLEQNVEKKRRTETIKDWNNIKIKSSIQLKIKKKSVEKILNEKKNEWVINTKSQLII